MTKKNIFLIFMVVLAFAVVLAAFTQEKADETAVDPVCGMTVVKAKAKATYEYDGKTYYFCSTGCKESFAKNPGEYLKKETEEKAEAMHAKHATETAAEMPHQMHGEMMGEHMGMEEGMTCPFHAQDVDLKVEKTADGVTLRITSSNPESVKAIQEHAAMMQEMKKSAGKEMEAGTCPGTCPMKKDSGK